MKTLSLIALSLSLLAGCSYEGPEGVTYDVAAPTKMAVLAPRNLRVRVTMVANGKPFPLYDVKGDAAGSEQVIHSFDIPPVGDRLIVAVGE